MLIRRFSPDDTKAVQRLNLEALEGTGAIPSAAGWDDDLRDIVSSYLTSGPGDFLVGVSTDIVVAMGGVILSGDAAAELKRLRVLPEFQGRGYARLLLNVLEARALELGARSIFADTTAQQVGAQGLYRSMGYQLLETREADGFVVLRFARVLAQP